MDNQKDKGAKRTLTPSNSEGKTEKLIKDSAKHAKTCGFKLNPDQKIVDRIMVGLLRNEKKYGKIYCPCRRVTGNEADDEKIICPCIYHKNEVAKDGKCFCGLFVK